MKFNYDDFLNRELLLALRQLILNYMEKRFSEFVTSILTKAGWYSGRNVDVLVSTWNQQLKYSEGWEIFPSAEKILLEFGGIRVNQNSPGITLARSTFEIDPCLAIGENDRFGDFERLLKMKLYPLGESDGGHFLLAVGEDGRIFKIMNDLLLAGDTFDKALGNLIIGIKSELIT